jgi:hypothetical protein
MQVKCNSCGANQEINSDSNCSFCESEIKIENAKDFFETAINSETGNLLTIADAALEASNYKEAIEYYNRVIEKQIASPDAWLGKGVATLLSSTIGEIKTNEAINHWKNSIKYAENQKFLQKRIAKIINNSIVSFYPALERHYGEFKDVEGTYAQFVERFLQLESALTFALTIDENNLALLESGYNLCQKVLSAYSRKNNKDSKYRGLDKETKETLVAMDSFIENLTVPKVLYEIEEKYVHALNGLDPNKNLISAKIKKEEADELAKRKKSEHQKKKLEELNVNKAKQGKIGIGFGFAISIFMVVVIAGKEGEFNFGEALVLVLVSPIIGYFIGRNSVKK